MIMEIEFRARFILICVLVYYGHAWKEEYLYWIFREWLGWRRPQIIDYMQEYWFFMPFLTGHAWKEFNIVNGWAEGVHK
jgi:hypothetical protein